MMEAVTGVTSVSEREAEVLAAVGEHLTNAEIAARLHISIRTVESHVSSLLRKLALADRRALAAVAADRGDPDPRGGSPAGGAAGRGLPAARTSFVGRRRELDQVVAAIGSARLVTLVGPGGVGKTRLAVTAASTTDFPFGSAFVDLVPVRAGFVAQAVATAIGVAERPHQPLEEAVHDRLRRGRSLLLMDNCEHLLDDVAVFVERLLDSCDDVVVLATSRERLGLLGERVVVVPPLSLVDEASGGAEGSEAVTLFIDRARASDPAFTADPGLVGRICARLDGMPLAIELAAARSASLGADGLLAGLDDHLRMVSGGRSATERHRSLRAVIDWSHDLLDPDERAIFRRLAVFSGGFDLAAAARVAGGPAVDGGPAVEGGRGAVDSAVAIADIVGRLTDKSLLSHRSEGASSRWRLLETVRVYALERLDESGDRAATHARHLEWATATAAELEQRMEADDEVPADFDAVVDDLRAALAAAPDIEGYRLASALAHLCYGRRFLGESRQHYEEAAHRAPTERDVLMSLRAAADVAFADMRADVAVQTLLRLADRAEQAGEQSIAAIAVADAATWGDRFTAEFGVRLSHERLCELVDRARALAPPEDPLVAAHVAAATAWNGTSVLTTADVGLAEVALKAARRAGDTILIVGALDAVASAALDAGDWAKAAHLTQERIGMLDLLARHDPRSGGEIVDIFHMAGEASLAIGDLPASLAAARFAEGDPIGQALPQMTASHLLFPLAMQGKFDQALVQADEMRRAWEAAGRPTSGWMAPSVYAVAMIHWLRGDDRSARTWQTLAREVTVHTGVRGFEPFVEIRTNFYLGRLEDAVAVVRAMPPERLGAYDPYARAAAAEVGVVTGLDDAEDLIEAASEAAHHHLWASACLMRVQGRRTGDRADLLAAVAAWETIGARFERACTLALLPDRAGEAAAELRALGCVPPA
jgi:predicted ATPase/DNA-binding CsgD family transcriptional regulator